MRLTIIRHGRTLENENGIIQGHLDGKLSPVGIEQMRCTAGFLKDENIDYIYSSDLGRAKESTDEIIKFQMQVFQLLLLMPTEHTKC